MRHPGLALRLAFLAAACALRGAGARDDPAIRDAAELATAHGFTEFGVEAAHAAIDLERATLPVVDRLRLLADELEMLVIEHCEGPANQTLALRETLTVLRQEPSHD